MRATFVLLASALAVFPAAQAKEEHEGSSDWFEVSTSSTVEFSNAPSLQLEGSAIGARAAGLPSGTILQLRGHVRNITIERYEANWTRVWTSKGLIESPRGMGYEVSKSWLAEAEISYEQGARRSAVVAVADHLVVEPTQSWVRARGNLHNPLLVGIGINFSPGSTSYNPEEEMTWRLPGDYLGLEHNGFRGTASEGSGALYWCIGNVTLGTGPGAYRLESKAWETPRDPMGLVTEHRVVWYILRYDVDRIELAAPVNDAIYSFLYTSGLSASGFGAISFDDQSDVQGTLPESAKHEGSSLWVTGDLNASARPGPEKAFRVRAEGDASAFAVAGGPAQLLDATTVAATTSLLVLILGGLAYLFRESVFAPLYSRLTKARVLDDSTRETLYALIKENPGIHFTGIQRLSGPASANGQLLHHLGKLERFGFVVTRREGRHRRYFDAVAVSAPDATRMELLENPAASEVARLVLERPGLSIGGLVTENGKSLPRRAVSYYVNKMRTCGLVEIREEGRVCRAYPLPDLRRILSARAASPVSFPAAAAVPAA